jgi:hypothetical protein
VFVAIALADIAADVIVVAPVVIGVDCAFGLTARQCLSYLIPNKTIKYSINAKNTNNVQDISHTYNSKNEKCHKIGF